MPAVVAAWSVLFGTAYVARHRLGARLGLTLGILCLAYGALAVAALAVVGIDARGALAAAGILVPASAAAVFVLAWR